MSSKTRNCRELRFLRTFQDHLQLWSVVFTSLCQVLDPDDSSSSFPTQRPVLQVQPQPSQSSKMMVTQICGQDAFYESLWCFWFTEITSPGRLHHGIEAKVLQQRSANCRNGKLQSQIGIISISEHKKITSLRVIPTMTSYYYIFVTNSDILCAEIWRGRKGEYNSDEI